MNGMAEDVQAHGRAPAGAGAGRKIIAGGSMLEGVGGLAAIILAILGLSGILPTDLMAVGVIGIGVSLLFEGGAVGARFSRLVANTGKIVGAPSELGGGMTAEFLAGAAGVVLGLLALLHIAPAILPPVAAIVFGGALLLGSGAAARLSYLEATNGSTPDGIDEVLREAVSASAGAQVLTGVAAALLGILALVGFNPTVLTLVAVLCLGTAVVLNATAVSGRILRLVS